MNKNTNISKFFLGANTPEGFFSRFDNLYTPSEDFFCYVIKGGPGTGKSMLMKKVAKAAKEKNIKTELIYCSSDPDSLDAVILPEKKICIADGTAPHSIDPTYPGASDTIINLSDCWNSKSLYVSRDNIIDLTKKVSNCHLKSRLYLKAYGNIYKSTLKMVSETADKTKIVNYSKRFLKKLFKGKSNAFGKEKIYFLSGITPKGIITFEETVNNYKDIYAIKDEFGIASNIILQHIRLEALNHGHDIITCFCPSDPKNKAECVLIPSLNAVFVTLNKIHSFESLAFKKKISTLRFFDSEKLKEIREKIKFNKKVSDELLKEAVDNLNKAKAIHDELEKNYISAMDFSKVDEIAENIIKKIFQH